MLWADPSRVWAKVPHQLLLQPPFLRVNDIPVWLPPAARRNTHLMKRMDLLTHPKWQQFLIQRSQVITWILNHHPALFQSPAKAGGFCKTVLHRHTHTHRHRHCVSSRGSCSAWVLSLMFGNNWIFPWFWATVCCLFHPLNLGLRHREMNMTEVGTAEMCSLCKAPPEHPQSVTQSSAALG